jgi:hypothetical protein
MAGDGQQFQASANINVSRFVSLSGDNTIATSGLGDNAIGIMHESAWETPIPGADENLAVPQYQSKRVYQDTESCEVVVGAVDVDAGMYLKPDAAGAAIQAAAGQAYSAVCTQGGLANKRCKVLVQHGIA